MQEPVHGITHDAVSDANQPFIDVPRAGAYHEGTHGVVCCDADAMDSDASDPAQMAALGEQIAELAAHIDAASYRLLEMILAFDEGEGWHGGFRSCGHWLSWRLGIDLGAARERVRVARSLPQLPAIAQALKHGRVSYSKVRALTRVANADN